jgi:hypothetical protein
VCCQVEVSATGWSLVQRSPTECGVSECDREASIMRRPRPQRGCRAIGKKCIYIYVYVFIYVTESKTSYLYSMRSSVVKILLVATSCAILPVCNCLK